MFKSNRRTALAGLSLAVLLISAQILQGEATGFIIGGACVVALQVAERAIGGQIQARGLTEAVDDVEALCRFIQRNSVGGVLYYRILPPLRQLIRVTGRQLTQVDATDEFETVVRQLAELSREVVG